REGGVVQIEDLVVESLERSFRKGDQADGKVQAGQPRGRLDQVGEVLEVDLDVLALADATHGGDETDAGVGLDHGGAPCRSARGVRVAHAGLHGGHAIADQLDLQLVLLFVPPRDGGETADGQAGPGNTAGGAIDEAAAQAGRPAPHAVLVGRAAQCENL